LRFKPLRFAHGLALCTIVAVAASKTLAQDPIAKPAVEAADETWTGFHAGAGIGARFLDSTWTTDCLAVLAMPGTCPNDTFGGATRIGNDNPAPFDDVGLRLNGFVGIDWQIASLVLGLEGEAAWADNESTHAGIPGTWSEDFGYDQNFARIESAWDASVRARAGFLLTPRTLVYSTGGLALMQQEVSATCAGTFPIGWCDTANADSAESVLVGWTAGGGIERMLSRAWILRGEYRYSDYGSQSLTLFQDEAIDSIAVTVEQKASMAYVGLSRRF
jgi:outer membrane immunogenic protein